MATAYEISMYIEGTNRRITRKHFELRLLGPLIEEVSHNYYIIRVNLFLLWSIKITEVDFHEQHKLPGILMATLKDICIYNGSGELWNPLTLIRSRNNYLGRTDSEVVQGTVEGDFEIKTGG